MITLREGLEISLIVAILLAYLDKSGRRHLFAAVWTGVAIATVACLVLAFALISMFGGLTGRSGMLVEGSMALIAAGVLTWMIFWMRRQARGIKGELEQRLANADSTTAVTVIAFTAVIREGLETVLFLLGTRGSSSASAALIGSALGFAVSAAVGVGVYRQSKLVNLRKFFAYSGAALILLAAGMVGYAAHELREFFGVEGLWATPVWSIESGPLASGIVHDLLKVFGWSPEPELIRVFAYIAYLVPVGAAYFAAPDPGGSGVLDRSRQQLQARTRFLLIVTPTALLMLAFGTTAQIQAWATERSAAGGSSAHAADDHHQGENEGESGGAQSERPCTGTTSRQAEPPRRDRGVREYWIAVEPERWAMAPGPDAMTGATIGASEFMALRMRAYTRNFGKRLPGNRQLGLAGPVIEARVGETILVHFRNLDDHYKLAHSLHPHGLEYTSAMDGAWSSMHAAKPGTAVCPGETFTYKWTAEQDSVGVWPYHDHSVDSELSTELGMFGAIRVRGPRERRVDREHYVFLKEFEPEVTKLERPFSTVNGRAYMGNTPRFRARVGEAVRFNVVALGTEFHNFHVHGYRWTGPDGAPQDVRSVGPAESWSVTLRATNRGHWMLHCHVGEHAEGGMVAEFVVGTR